MFSRGLTMRWYEYVFIITVYHQDSLLIAVTVVVNTILGSMGRHKARMVRTPIQVD